MAGLRNICKQYGGMTVIDSVGKKTTYKWDYKKNKPVKQSDESQNHKAKGKI
jgi:hypothetical protein